MLRNRPTSDTARWGLNRFPSSISLVLADSLLKERDAVAAYLESSEGRAAVSVHCRLQVEPLIHVLKLTIEALVQGRFTGYPG